MSWLRPDRELPPGQKGQGVDATLAAVATLTAAWPISTLLIQPTWLRGTILLLAVVALSGVGARRLTRRGWQVLTVQSTCLVLAIGAVYGRDHLWYGLPTFETVRFFDGLVRQAFATAQSYAAPAPTTTGLTFVVGCSLGLVALAVDNLAVTRRSPSLAGLPLLTVFLATVANRGTTLPFIFFVAVSGMWLILVARAGRTSLHRWSNAVAMASTPARQSLDSRGVYEYAATARMLGGVALVAAVVLPVMLPHLSPTFLASGLARKSPANGNSADTVGFSQSLDLGADLRDPSTTPVLQYTTANGSPPPLRIAVGSFYRADPGVWLPWGRPWSSSSGDSDLSTNPRVPDAPGLSAEVPRRTFAMDVRVNLLEDPYLASPYPLVGADLKGVPWGADVQTQSIRVARRTDSYTVSYLRLEPTATMLESAPPLADQDRHLFDLDLALEGPYLGKVSALTQRLTAGRASPFAKAMAIQEYLRADGGFTYSLTLAPPAKDRTGKDAGFDSLTNFLVTKQGYCVQFATAMVMMSRAAGIPARIALGFLPGNQAKGVWTVVAADAHAWPELYLGGIGWTRFEPTPARVAPPAYAVLAKSGSGTAGNPSPGAVKPQGTVRAGQKDLSAGSLGIAVQQESGPSAMSALRWLTHGWGLLLLGILTVLLGSLVVPTAGLWRRRRRLSAARTDLAGRAMVEVEWEHLTSSLGDLGIAPAPSDTPRQQRAYYDREALLPGPASQALGRAVETLEHSRYQASPPQPGTLAADTRQVIKAAAAGRAGRVRLRAAWWPSSGLTQLGSVRASFARRFGGPGRRLRGLMHK